MHLTPGVREPTPLLDLIEVFITLLNVLTVNDLLKVCIVDILRVDLRNDSP